MDPADSADSVDPVDPVDPADSVDPMDPGVLILFSVFTRFFLLYFRIETPEPLSGPPDVTLVAPGPNPDAGNPDFLHCFTFRRSL